MADTGYKTTFQEERLLPNSVESDYKGEVVAAGIIESGSDIEQVYISRLGNASRGYSKDIEYIETGISGQGTSTHAGIFINRPGIYDSLPEGIFHKIKSYPINKTKEEIIAEMRRLHKEENTARQLFRPFEQAVDNVLINAQLYERQLDKKYTNRNFVNIFSRMWPIVDLLPLHKAVLFIEIIPLISKIACRPATVSSVMSALLDIPVTVKRGKRTLFKVDRSILPRLCEMRLDINAIIGDTFSDGRFYTDIRMGPMPEDKLVYYRTDKNGKKTIQSLTDILLPADSEINYQYLPLAGTNKCVISEDKTTASRLGINTYF